MSPGLPSDGRDLEVGESVEDYGTLRYNRINSNQLEDFLPV